MEKTPQNGAVKKVPKKFPFQPMRVFVINLARSTERRRLMEDTLAGTGLDYEFFPAVDGAKINSPYESYYSSEAAISSHGKELSTGEIGCALSHIAIYQKIVDEKIAFSLILEDDVALAPEILTVSSAAISGPDAWELINLITDVDELLTHAPAGAATHSLTSFNGAPNRTGGYLITEAGAHKLLAVALPLRVPADTLTGCFELSGVATRGLYPAVATLMPLKSTFQRGNYPPKKLVWDRKVPSHHNSEVLVLNPELIPSRPWVLWHTLRSYLGPAKRWVISLANKRFARRRRRS